MKDTVHGFREVDQAEDAQYYFQFLDELSVLRSVQECRDWMLDMLDIGPGHQLLDIGCGVGDAVRAMARLTGKTGKAVGLDNSQVTDRPARTINWIYSDPMTRRGTEFRGPDDHRPPLVSASN